MDINRRNYMPHAENIHYWPPESSSIAWQLCSARANPAKFPNAIRIPLVALELYRPPLRAEISLGQSSWHVDISDSDCIR